MRDRRRRRIRSEAGWIISFAAPGADELMVTANIFDHAKRKRSFEIVAEVHGGMTVNT